MAGEKKSRQFVPEAQSWPYEPILEKKVHFAFEESRKCWKGNLL